MADEKPVQAPQIGSSLGRERVFRPGRKGAWHLMAHKEYGVIWSHCGVRVMVKECTVPEGDVLIRDLCGTCARKAKSELGKEGAPGAAPES